MGHWKKTLEQVKSGDRDAGIRFDDLCHLLTRLGFARRNAGGSHRLFKQPGAALINLQAAGGMAKSYQVRQVREILNQLGL